MRTNYHKGIFNGAKGLSRYASASSLSDMPSLFFGILIIPSASVRVVILQDPLGNWDEISFPSTEPIFTRRNSS